MKNDVQDFYNIIPFPRFVSPDEGKVDFNSLSVLSELPSVTPEKKGNIPSLWSNAIAILTERTKPKGISEPRWRDITKRLDSLIHEERKHFLKMIEYEWPLVDVFGCHKFAPDVRIDAMGLLMLLPQRNFSDIEPTKALLKDRNGTTASYYLMHPQRHHMSEQSSLMEVE